MRLIAIATFAAILLCIAYFSIPTLLTVLGWVFVAIVFGVISVLVDELC